MSAEVIRAGLPPDDLSGGNFSAKVSGVDKKLGVVHALKGVSISMRCGW